MYLLRSNTNEWNIAVNKEVNKEREEHCSNWKEGRRRNVLLERKGTLGLFQYKYNYKGTERGAGLTRIPPQNVLSLSCPTAKTSWQSISSNDNKSENKNRHLRLLLLGSCKADSLTFSFSTAWGISRYEKEITLRRESTGIGLLAAEPKPAMEARWKAIWRQRHQSGTESQRKFACASGWTIQSSLIVRGR